MSIEHIDNGGRLVLHRNPAYVASDGSSVGRFSMGDIREFLFEAEVAGATDDSCIWFDFDTNSYSNRIDSIHFKMQGGMVTREKPKSVIPFPKAAVAYTSALWLIIVMLVVFF